MPKKSTGPDIKQIPYRLHVNDHAAFKSKCAIVGVKMQTVVEACVMAFLDGDQHIRTLAEEYKVVNTMERKTASWSPREGENILDELEMLEGDDLP